MNPILTNFKIYILLVVVAMLDFNVMAQDTDTENKPVVAIAVERMNVLYAGLPNPVTIAVSSVAPEKLRISWGGATVINTGSGSYNVDVPDSLVGRELIITIAVEKERGEVQILENKAFRVKGVPEPNVFVGGNIRGGCHSKKAILANPFLTARMGNDFNYHLMWQVLSYKVTFVKNGVAEPPIIVEGAKFSEQVIEKIRKAQRGTIIEFSEVKIQNFARCCEIQNPIVIRICKEKKS